MILPWQRAFFEGLDWHISPGGQSRHMRDDRPLDFREGRRREDKQFEPVLLAIER